MRESQYVERQAVGFEEESDTSYQRLRVETTHIRDTETLTGVGLRRVPKFNDVTRGKFEGGLVSSGEGRGPG